jgi:phosphate transport system permease protein
MASASSVHRLDAATRRRNGFSRRASSMAGWAICGLALLALVGMMLSILGAVFVRGMSALSPELFTSATSGRGGGLLNAIEGTIVLSAGALLLATPIGVAAGIYSSEYPSTRWASVIRFLSDVLVGVPSIVLGYFGYVTMVEWLGWNFSVAAASIVLAMICMPYICRTTELALRQVSNDLREAAYAVGANDRQVILRMCVRPAAPGILMGVLLALAISVGETAPLIYTAGWCPTCGMGASPTRRSAT